MDNKNDEYKERVLKLIEDKVQSKIDDYLKQPAKKVDMLVSSNTGSGVGNLKGLHKGFNLKNQGQNLNFKTLQQKEEFIITTLDWIDKKTLQGGSGGGSYTVPEFWQDQVFALAEQSGFALRDSQLVEMTSDVMHIPKETSKPTAYWVSESAPISAADPGIDEVKIDLTKKLAVLTKCSNELISDSQVEIVSYLANTMGRQLAYQIDLEAVTAAQSYFDGLLAGATNVVTMGSSGTVANIDKDDLSAVIGKLDTAQLEGSKFYMHRTVLEHIRNLEDTAGNPIFPPDSSGVSSIWTRPIFTSPVFPTTAKFLLFGNLRQAYVIGQNKSNTQLDIDPYSFFANAETQFRMYLRLQGKVLFGNALVALQVQ